MSRDYKNVERKGGGRGNGSSLLVGIFIGLALGLIIALMVAWYINKMPSPFSSRAPAMRSEASKAQPTPVTPPSESGNAKTTDDKQRFDFYKILPGKEETAPDQGKDAAKPAPEGKEAFFLQAGAFSSAPEADNLKARLALLGVEAAIQSTPNADKGLMHRVRVGPYTNVDELNRVRETLKQNGIQTTLIRVREPEK
jgi:cell division protein FtsN